jgi:hypothetical protein
MNYFSKGNSTESVHGDAVPRVAPDRRCMDPWPGFNELKGYVVF